MKSFDYVRPASVEEAITAASLPGAAYLAAGTNLLDLMKGGVNRPDRLVDVMHLPGLDRVEPLGDGGLRIGALVRNADLAHDAAFAGTYPAVAEALLSGASAQLRNAATVGGNHRGLGTGSNSNRRDIVAVAAGIGTWLPSCWNTSLSSGHSRRDSSSKETRLPPT